MRHTTLILLEARPPAQKATGYWNWILFFNLHRTLVTPPQISGADVPRSLLSGVGREYPAGLHIRERAALEQRAVDASVPVRRRRYPPARLRFRVYLIELLSWFSVYLI